MLAAAALRFAQRGSSSFASRTSLRCPLQLASGDRLPCQPLAAEQ